MAEFICVPANVFAAQWRAGNPPDRSVGVRALNKAAKTSRISRSNRREATLPRLPVAAKC